MKSENPASGRLLHWFAGARRSLPFRQEPTPYHIWVSEIMLQQTRVSAVLPYYTRFITALPDIASLAACGEDELHKLWEGLGYYSRVRNMQKAAQAVVRQYGGCLPADYKALLALPGIGPYTAGAIASLAFGLPEVAVDGNVLRVFSRLLADEGDITRPEVKARLTEAVRAWQPPGAPGPYNEAIMELGALVCLPGAPRCGECPLRDLCKAYERGIAATLPNKAPQKPRKTEQYTVLVVNSGDRVLLVRRPQKGLLAGLWQPLLLPGWLNYEDARQVLEECLGCSPALRELPPARHVFTHREWHMRGWQCSFPEKAPPPTDGLFVTKEQQQAGYPLPSAFDAYRSAFFEKAAGR